MSYWFLLEFVAYFAGLGLSVYAIFCGTNVHIDRPEVFWPAVVGVFVAAVIVRIAQVRGGRGDLSD